MSNTATYGDFPVVEGLLTSYGNAAGALVARSIKAVSAWFSLASDEVVHPDGGYTQHHLTHSHHLAHSHDHSHAAGHTHHADEGFEHQHEYLAQLRTRQILEREMGADNLRVARGGRVMSYHDQPIRPEPQSIMGRLLKLFTRGSAPAPEKS